MAIEDASNELRRSNEGQGLDRRLLLPSVVARETSAGEGIDSKLEKVATNIEASDEILLTIHDRLEEVVQVLKSLETNGIKTTGDGKGSGPGILRRVGGFVGKVAGIAASPITFPLGLLKDFKDAFVGGIRSIIELPGKIIGGIGKGIGAVIKSPFKLIGKLFESKDMKALVALSQEQLNTQKEILSSLEAFKSAYMEEIKRQRRQNLDNLERRRDNNRAPIVTPVSANDRKDKDDMGDDNTGPQDKRSLMQKIKEGIIDLLGIALGGGIVLKTLLRPLGRLLAGGFRGVRNIITGRPFRGNTNTTTSPYQSNNQARTNNTSNRINNTNTNNTSNRTNNTNPNNTSNNTSNRANNSSVRNRIFNTVKNIAGNAFRFGTGSLLAPLSYLGSATPLADGTMSGLQGPNFPGDRSQEGSLSEARQRAIMEKISIENAQKERSEQEKMIFDKTTEKLVTDAQIQNAQKERLEQEKKIFDQTTEKLVTDSQIQNAQKERLEQEKMIFDKTSERLASQPLAKVEIDNKAPIEVIVVNGDDIGGKIDIEQAPEVKNIIEGLSNVNERSKLPEINIERIEPSIGGTMVTPITGDSLVPIPKISSGSANLISGQIARIEGERIDQSLANPIANSGSLPNVPFNNSARNDSVEKADNQFTPNEKEKNQLNAVKAISNAIQTEINNVSNSPKYKNDYSEQSTNNMLNEVVTKLRNKNVSYQLNNGNYSTIENIGQKMNLTPKDLYNKGTISDAILRTNLFPDMTVVRPNMNDMTITGQGAIIPKRMIEGQNNLSPTSNMTLPSTPDNPFLQEMENSIMLASNKGGGDFIAAPTNIIDSRSDNSVQNTTVVNSTGITTVDNAFDKVIPV